MTCAGRYVKFLLLLSSALYPAWFRPEVVDGGGVGEEVSGRRRILVVPSPYGASNSKFILHLATVLARPGDGGYDVTVLAMRNTKSLYDEMVAGTTELNIRFHLLTSPELDSSLLELEDTISRLPLWDTPAQVTHHHVLEPTLPLLRLYCQALVSDPGLGASLAAARYHLAIVGEQQNMCGLALVSEVLHLPYTLAVATTPYPGTAYLLGLPRPPSHVPSVMSGFPGQMGFLQRVKNTFEVLENIYEMSYMYNAHASQDFLWLHHVPHTTMNRLYSGASFIFVNSHHSLDMPRPDPPHVAYLGGIHCEDTPPPLPKEILTFMNSGGDGVILINLGHLVSTLSTPPSVITVLRRVLAEFSEYRIVFVYQGPTPKSELNFADNILIVENIEQQSVLAHPKTRLFITDGRMLSCVEAAYHGVPVIGIPMYMDQIDNIERLVEREMAVKIDKLLLGKRRLRVAMNATLVNQRYRDSAGHQSRILRDTLAPPSRLLHYWTAYVIRYQGAAHLRDEAGHRLWFFQYFLLDVFLFVASCVAIMLVTLTVVFRRPTRRKRTRTHSEKKEQ